MTIDDIRRIPILRAAVALGPLHLARFAALVSFTMCFIVVLALWRPDLLRPSDIGSDSSNYFAAGLRLVQGNPLYELTAGDRPVPADNPPLWSAPLLSPPPIALLWAIPALVTTGSAAMHGWWLIGALGTAATASVALASGSLLTLLSLFVLAPAVALTAASGNLNAWLVPAFALVYHLSKRRPTAMVVALLALMAGTAAAVKLGPVLIIWWLMVVGRRTAALGAVGIAALVGAVSVIVAGPASLRAYLELSAMTASVGATRLSATALAEALGVPGDVASLAPIVCVGASALGVFALRRRVHLAFVVALLGTVFATPVVRFESFAVLIAGGAASVALGPRIGSKVSRRRITGGLALSLGGLVAFGSWTGSATRSSLAIENRSGIPVVVRIGPVAQSATFGFRVGPGEVVRGYNLLDGGLSGQVVILGPECRILAEVPPPAPGGRLVIEVDGTPQFESDDSVVAPLGRYVADCAGR